MSIVADKGGLPERGKFGQRSNRHYKCLPGNDGLPKAFESVLSIACQVMMVPGNGGAR